MTPPRACGEMAFDRCDVAENKAALARYESSKSARPSARWTVQGSRTPRWWNKVPPPQKARDPAQLVHQRAQLKRQIDLFVRLGNADDLPFSRSWLGHT